MRSATIKKYICAALCALFILICASCGDVGQIRVPERADTGDPHPDLILLYDAEAQTEETGSVSEVAEATGPAETSGADDTEALLVIVAADDGTGAVPDRIAPLDEVTAEEAEQEPSDRTSQTVYVTETGSKYHRSGCGYLRRSKHAISLDDAKAKGYTPCSRCYG